MKKKFTFLIAAMALIFAIIGPREAWGQEIPSTSTFTEKTFSQLADGDVVIFASTTGKAMSNATQTTGKPAQVGITVGGSTGSLSITPGSGNLDDIAWTLTAATNGFTFYQYGSTANRLCITATSSNTAAKVTDATSSYTIMCMGSLGKNMQFYGATRFLGCYTSGSDWRTYNSEEASNYGGSSTKFYVLNASTPSTDPTITCANITDVPYQGVNNATATVTFNNATGWTPSISAFDGIVVTTASLSENTVTYSVSENEGDTDREGSFTITLSKDGEEPVSKVVSVTQNHFVVDYATLPFSYDGNGSGELPSGLTQNGLGTYSSSPKMKFDDTGDYLILKINENPGTLTFKIKGNSFSGGTFKLQTSTDGETYTDKKSYTTLGDVQTETIADLDASVRYIKWIYTTKASGNVALGDINLTKEGVKIPTFSIEEGNYWASQSVALSQADSKPIYYTTNEDNPTTNGTLYSEAISVTSTCTIKAAAQDGTEWSDVVSATYKIAQTYTTAASVNALTEDNIPVIVSMDNWTIESINGKSMYVNDGTNSLQIYDYYIPENYAVGGKLSGSLKAVWTTEYSGEVKTVQNWDEINYSAPTFAIEIDDEIENGTIEAISTTAPAGTEISFAVNPNDGYRMVANSLIVLDATGDDVDFTGDNPYTFTMPASDVTISAEFELIPATTFSYLYSINGIDNTEVVVAEGSVITLDDGIDIDDNFTFAGWTTDESDVDYILAAGSDYTIDDDVIFYAVYAKEEGGEAVRPTAYTAGDEGNFVIATLVEETYYAIPANPTVSSGKITGVEIQTESSNNVTYVSGANAIGYTWTIANATNGQTLSDGVNYLYHKNGGNSGTDLYYGNSTSYTWSIISEDNGLSFQAMNNGEVKTRGLLCQKGNPNKFGGYALSNEDGADYSRIVVLPIASNSDIIHYYTRVFLNETAVADITIGGPSIIPAGSTLNMDTYTLANATVANLIIEDGAQLIVNNSGVQATMKKNIENSDSSEKESEVNWYTISSPLAANTEFANVTNLIPNEVTDTDYDLYRFDEKNGMWINSRIYDNDETIIIANPDFTTINKGVGYIYSNQVETTIAFTGEINVADVECELTNAAAHGFNLIGNPFTQNIILDNVAGAAELANGFYVLYNDETWRTKLTDSKIKPLQGFLVQATTAGNVTISKNVSSKGGRSNEQNANIEIVVSNDNYKDNAYAMFGEGIGLNKVSHRNAEAPMLYIPQDGEDFAIAMMDENVTLFPVSFKAMTTGHYTISLKSSQIYEGYNDFDYIHLIDNMTGEETDMLVEDGYEFVGSPRDNAGRFTVKLHRNGIEENDVEVANFVYQYGNELVIDGEGALQVFDVLGRVVISEEVHGQRVDVSNLNTGAYIVRLTGESVMTQKIVIK